MIEVLQFYVSGFWIWAGITIGVGVAGQAVALVLATMLGGRR